VLVKTKDEIGELAGAFNKMAVNLKTITASREELEKEVADYVLEKAIELTKSSVGFLRILDEDEKMLTIQSWSSEVMKECAVPDSSIHLSVEKAGLWAEAVRQRKAIIVNTDAVVASGQDLPTMAPFLKSIKYHGPEPKGMDGFIQGLVSRPEAMPTLKDMEASYIFRLVQRAGNNLGEAAKILGMDYTSLYRRLKKLEKK
jgi:transcriptional regulator of acetoin/glycerol metabolism